jgi:hypothetical protein
MSEQTTKEENKQVIIVTPGDIGETKFLLQPGREVDVIIADKGFQPSDKRKK